MQKVAILFPHQLFEGHEIINNCDHLYLVEEHLFFNQFSFHKQKLAFHRASMKAFEESLDIEPNNTTYISSQKKEADIRELIPVIFKKHKPEEIHYIDPTDDWLSRRLKAAAKKVRVQLVSYENPLFINSLEELGTYFKPDRKSFFQTSFYKQERKRLDILMDKEGKPEGGKWTYDTENRKKFPKGSTPPPIHYPEPSKHWDEAKTFVEKHFKNNPGIITEDPLYPLDHDSSRKWLQQFLEFRFHYFGHYEDAIVREEVILHHSVLSPLINAGLLSVTEVLDEALDFAKAENVPINSTEGFVRQIIGWREFMRGMYEVKGRESRTINFWKFKRKLPKSFYDGTTGIDPLDQTIKKVLETGYCHHIERLMVLGNFMLLCEIDPDEVYKWFMELFIDAYDWVMVPNVYSMSQFADGGLFATKPYISSSNYIKKMSDYKNGDWQKIWDGLFWNFMSNQKEFFEKNPRSSMLLRVFEKMPKEKQEAHVKVAEEFLAGLK
ncbi:MAG: cryptochrome/photolyase family protein [Saprospiraceae bacterium]